MISVCRAVLVATLMAFASVPSTLWAATFVVPPDDMLIDNSTAVVFGTVVDAVPRFSDDGEIETVFRVAVDEVLKGNLSSNQVSVVEWGGRIGREATVTSGGPRYEIGQSYLIFMVANRDGEWTTQYLTLGRFQKVRSAKGDLLVRDVSQIHGWDIHGNEAVEIGRHAEPFREFIRRHVAGIRTNPAYFVDDVPTNPLTVRATEVAPNFAGYDFDDACEVGAASWTDDSGSDVQYSIGGTTSDSVVNLASGEDKIIEEDPNGVIAGTFTGAGVVAEARWRITGDHSFDGKTFDTIIGSNVITQNGVKDSNLGQSKFRTAMAHELGHTLGFRHSNEECPPGPCTSAAVMNASVDALDGELQQWDIDAVRAVYGDGGDASHYVTGRRTNTAITFLRAKAACLPVAITTHPQNKTVEVGATTFLSVTPGGTGPFTFQWYSGTTGNISNPIEGATTNTLDVTPTSVGVTSYWVRVGHTCDGVTVDSNAATVTATCTNPAITGQPQDVTITGGQSTTLQVNATGSSLTFQWFRGPAGNTSNPVGTSSNRLTVNPLETTQYWVRISGACGTPVDSNTVTVTVVPCAEITVNPPTATAGTGVGKYTLNVTASSTATPLSFGWFRGGTPGFGGSPIGTSQSVNVTVTAATNFWARVQNSCGRVEFSSIITVAPCTLPTITTQPQDQTINSGATANLSIAFSAGATVKWYRGSVGDKTNQVGTTANVTVGPLTQTTKFWAEVSTSCGPVVSREVTVTVRQLSELVNLLGGRFFVQVNYKNQFDNGKTGKLLGRSLFSTALSETAVFTFGDQNVVELLVRVSDARPFDDNIHVFIGGLSDVEFSVVVTDSLTGVIHEYNKPANQLIGVIDRTTFPAANVLPPPIALKIEPTAETSTIRLLNNRFEVRMRYRNQFTNPAGEGYMNARSIASSPTTETAVFFFDENVGSAEWMVRFSDARPFANRIDMFHGGLSDVEFTIEVLDTQTGLRKEYHKGPFSLLGQVDRDSYLP